MKSTAGSARVRPKEPRPREVATWRSGGEEMTRAFWWVTQGSQEEVREAARLQDVVDGGASDGGCIVVGDAAFLDGEALAILSSRWRLGVLTGDVGPETVRRLATLGYHHVLRWPRDREAIQDTVAALEGRESPAHAPWVRERLALQVARVGVWEIDVQTLRISWDDRVTELLGTPPEHSTSYEDAVERYVAPTDVIRVAELVTNVVTTGSSRPLILNVKSTDGGRHTIRVSAALVDGRVLGVLQDISEVRQLEQALYESESRLRGIVESAADGIITIDAHGVVHSLNPAARRLFGLSIDTPQTGLELTALVRSARTLLEFDSTGGGLFLMEGRRVDGTTVELEAAVSASGPDGVRTVVLRDVTMRNQEALRLRDATDRVMDTVARELHDDLGQTLTAIALTARKLELDVAAPLRPLAASMIQQANDAIGVVRRISTGLAAESQRPLGDLLIELSRRMEGVFSMRCSVNISVNFPPLPLPAVAHLRLLAKEALLNAWRHGQARQATVVLKEEDGQGVLEISNDGLPLPQPLPAYGAGVSSMAHRARLVGGTLQLSNVQTGGVKLRCTFALAGR